MQLRQFEILKKQCMRTARNQGVSDPHDAESIAHDAIMDEKSKGFEIRKAKQLAINFLKKRRLKIAFSIDDDIVDGEDKLSWHDVMELDQSNEINTALQAHQRQLIEELASGKDERTTEIVQTWLDSDRPTIYSVSKELGLDFNQVKRDLVKLSKNDKPVIRDLKDSLTIESIIA